VTDLLCLDGSMATKSLVNIADTIRRTAKGSSAMLLTCQITLPHFQRSIQQIVTLQFTLSQLPKLGLLLGDCSQKAGQALLSASVVAATSHAVAMTGSTNIRSPCACR
jgi:hypothetical protein